MATAKLNPPDPPKPDVILTLPYDEAVTLMSLLGDIPGDAATTYRKHTDATYWALEKLGLTCVVRFKSAITPLEIE